MSDDPERAGDDEGPLSPDPEAAPGGDGEDGPQDLRDDSGDVDEGTKSDVEADEEIEKLQPKELPVERIIIDAKGRSGTYIQKTLTWFGKIELYGVLGRAVEIAMQGDTGIGVEDIMDIANPRKMIEQLMGQLPGADTSPDAGEQGQIGLQEAAKMMATFAKVVSISPPLLKEAYCIVLGAPDGHRKWLMEWGLSSIEDEMGKDILHTFVDQNWGVMEDFFARELPKVMRRVSQARKRSASAQSKR